MTPCLPAEHPGLQSTWKMFNLRFICKHSDMSTAANKRYRGPSILRPPMGPRKCGLILQVVLK